ncbi:DUF6095 family protein [Arenibacter sp. GZD96]|uniref:DUF6095 family protein n=1 Tax=Aurantibrevibacter litoralis TaxID=3106030 RepID=UPI002AFE7727|nr:DUF6095 family protein [Arenibacter sp. GZD-96]MEA1786963.1 DUF6095 family protein [Arenibacter sp. GZD-96]
MRKDPSLFIKSLKYFGITTLLMFTAPIVIYQAFKNQNHPFYIPVLIVGLVLAVTAIVMGFISVKKLMNFIFQKKK